MYSCININSNTLLNIVIEVIRWDFKIAVSREESVDRINTHTYTLVFFTFYRMQTKYAIE